MRCEGIEYVACNNALLRVNKCSRICKVEKTGELIIKIEQLQKKGNKY